MSAINNALSQLSQSQTVAQTSIEKAKVPAIKRFRALPWFVGGFSLSLAVGGWAISQQPLPNKVMTNHTKQPAEQIDLLSSEFASPTSKLAQASDAIYDAPLLEQQETVVAKQPSITAMRDIPTPQAIEKPLSPVIEHDVATKSVVKRSHTSESKGTQTSSQYVNAKSKTEIAQQVSDEAPGEVLVEQVEFTPSQLAEKALDRAEKALDANDLDKALEAYEEALRYTPRDSQARQKLAALYYGKGNVRKAAELLQKGISLKQDDLGLRIALTKLLIKEKQNAAALTPLTYLPESPTVEYLSLRAALAQKNAQDELALESYQRLVQVDSDNGRWWLGLGIQLERAFELQPASQAYQQALTKVGLSSQSHQFIRDRLALLSSIEEQSNAN